MPNCSAMTSGRMIRQHDAAGADADGLGASSDVANDDGRGGAGDAGHVVVFGKPKPVVAPGFRVLREVERVAQSDSGGCALRNRREIENGEGNHVHWMPWSMLKLRREFWTVVKSLRRGLRRFEAPKWGFSAGSYCMR